MLRIILLLLAAFIMALFFLPRTFKDKKDKELRPIDSFITIRQQDCSQNDGNNNNIFKLRAVNTTSQALSNIKVDLAIGVADKLVHKEITVNRLDKGGVISLEEEIFYPRDIDVCFAKFSQNGQQIMAVFRP